MSQDFEHAAYRAAGHAIMATMCGGEVSCVYTAPALTQHGQPHRSRYARGWCEHSLPKVDKDVLSQVRAGNHPDGSAVKLQVQRLVFVAAAGPVAEVRSQIGESNVTFEDVRARANFAEAWDDSCDLLEPMYPNPTECAERVRVLWNRATIRMARPGAWSAVQELSQMLIQGSRSSLMPGVRATMSVEGSIVMRIAERHFGDLDRR